MASSQVPSDWHETTLGSIANNEYGLVDGPFGSNLPASAYTETGIPIIRGSNLTLGQERFRGKEFVFVSRETATRLSRSLCVPGDIIFTKKGTLGQTGIVPANLNFENFLLSSNQMKLSVDEQAAQSLYVYYYVSSPASREKIVRDAEATGVPKTNLAYLRNFPILLPPLHEQQAIAHILGTLDDKIELNRRMNETLEATARALFKSWFVDFDPVRAKAEKRQPAGMDAETAALFPSSFEESPLGLIPEGWHTGTLGELVYLVTERVHATPAKDRERYIALEDMPSKSIDLSNYQQGNMVNSSIIRFKEGDILFGSMRPYFHKVGLAQFDGITRTTTFVLRPKQDLSTAFALFQFASNEVVGYSTAASVGSTIPYVKWETLADYETVIPADEPVRNFNEVIRPFIRAIKTNGEQTHTLAALRDALLPRLLSGAIRVREAEREVGQVA